MSLKLIIELILSIPKSLRFCLHYFPFLDAIKLPVIVNRNTKVINLSGKIYLNEKKQR